MQRNNHIKIHVQIVLSNNSRTAAKSHQKINQCNDLS